MNILTPDDLEKLAQNPHAPNIKEADNDLGFKRIEPDLAICCVCKRPNATFATADPPSGYRWGGWFCGGCLIQGQETKEVRYDFNHLTNRMIFDKDGKAIEIK